MKLNLCGFIVAALVAAFTTAAHAQTLFLGEADSFAVLGGSTVTNTGPTIVNGNLGVSPGSAITGFPPGVVINGNTFTGAASLAGRAHADTITAFNVLANETPTRNLTGINLGGLTLGPGIYNFDTSAQLTGILRLNTMGNVDAIFHFLIGTTLTTASNSSVITLGLGGAPGRNIFWKVGSSATLGTGTNFQGNILAQQSITLNTGASIQGRALAINGAVTLASSSVSNSGLLGLTTVVGPGGTVVLVLQQGLFSNLSCLTPNQASVAGALDKLAANNPISPLILALDSIPVNSIGASLDLLTPVSYAAIFDSGFALAEVQSGNIERRLGDLRDTAPNSDFSGTDSHGTVSIYGKGGGKQVMDGKGKIVADLEPDRRWAFYITGTGQWVDVESASTNGCVGPSGTAGSDFMTAGVTVGADYRLTQNFAVGLATGYANTGVDGAGDGKMNINHANASAYATWFDNGFYVNGIVGGGYSFYDLKRESLGGIARAETEGANFSGSIGAGYEHRTGPWTFGPIAALQYTTIGIDGFTEQGSLSPLKLSDQSESSFHSRVGARVSYAWKIGGVIVTPELRAQWRHEFQDSSRGIGASFAEDASASFNVRGPEIGRDSLLLDVGASVRFSPRTSVFAYYTGNVGADNYTSHALNGGVRIAF